MLLIGIDEAGYGPLLGPLCHGYCALRVPDTAHAPCVWKLLAPAVSRFPSETDALVIDDSKKIHAAADGLAQLKRGVNAFLNGGSHWLATLLDAAELAALEADPWGRGVDNARESRSAALNFACSRASVDILACGARALSATDFNRYLKSNANKADLNAARMCEILNALLKLARPGERVLAVIDRLGGRKFYSDCLQTVFPGEMLWVRAETKTLSAYRIERSGSEVVVEFRVGAESEWLPVALGSMAAKLTRELCMERFNAFFRAHQPGLAPTAGYTTDARRFLKETAALRKQLGIEDGVLIRVK